MTQIVVIGLQTAAPLLYSELLQVAYAKVNYWLNSYILLAILSRISSPVNKTE
ncbi:hypothetical protein [Anabaena sp. CS-542/02]|uniref:hypothetical protein n=1 Tax=Anabaena sp. CS-542/02 TaxID=3021719 RepID=UPI00232DC622|nr:hypothetical protein [Anabaena sp. CS-542/02]MDB9448211.1 hypothetical protein [Anabaena sp. CS-542/02]